MNHDEAVAAVARKLYRFTRADVAEVLDVLIELWQEELFQRDGVITINHVGRLYVDEQEVSTRGAVQQVLKAYQQPVPATIKRYYFRFQPSPTFKRRVAEYRQQKGTDYE